MRQANYIAATEGTGYAGFCPDPCSPRGLPWEFEDTEEAVFVELEAPTVPQR